MKIKISIGDEIFDAELYDNEMAEAVKEALPIKGQGSFWGKEIYFTIPVNKNPDNVQETVEKGDLAYWPPGKAFCIFWGPTPASRGNDEIRPASDVAVFGRISGGLERLNTLRSASPVRVSAAE